MSFLPPGEEETLRKTWPGAFLGTRTVSRAVRAQARRLYVDLIAEIGATKIDGRTLRQALAPAGEVSAWWFHPTSAKDCETDPAFDWIIALLTIELVFKERACTELVLCGAPAEIMSALGRFTQVSSSGVPPRRTLKLLVQSLASRAKFVLTMIQHKSALRRPRARAAKPVDVALFGFWDWSVRPDGSGGLKDRYLGSLPQALQTAGLSSAYFAWFDPSWEPGKGGRSAAAALSPLSGRNDVVILQDYITPQEAARAALDFSSLFLFLKIRGLKSFRSLFLRGTIDFHPLFSDRLLAGFMDARLPRLRLAALACERAFKDLRPRAAVSFLEHYPFARAFYEGARRAGGVFCAAVQHACYNSEKTFLFLHPELELAGKPDGCKIPQPDAVCAMGELGLSLFSQCGYAPERVAMTGSPRYDRLAPALNSAVQSRASGKIRVLLTLSLDTGHELELVEAACLAADENIEIVVRDHPFARIAGHPGFAAYKSRVRISVGTLDEDLARADMVMFTYSAAAEEAFLMGKPVWQWLTFRYDASALAESVTLPRFAEVGKLRGAFREFEADPTRFMTSENIRRTAFEKIFSGRDENGVAGDAPARISRLIKGSMAGRQSVARHG